MMRHAFSRDPWYWGFGFNAPLDFCVWALEIDGLRAEPFDQHPEGDGSLRERGLTPDGWLGWLREVTRLQGDTDARREWTNELTRRMRQPGAEPPAGPRPPLPAFLYPPAAWSGIPEVSLHLAALWERYAAFLNERKLVDPIASSGRNFHSVEGRLWRDLKPYHAGMPRLLVHVVAYPGPVRYVAAPDAIVLGMSAPAWNWDAERFRATILEAAEAVAAQAG